MMILRLRQVTLDGPLVRPT
jgi:hypothetical protein